MVILGALAFIIHVAVALRGIFYLATTNSRRAGDKEVVVVLTIISVLHLMARVVVWIHPTVYAHAPVAEALFTAYAVATASVFLALINCYAKTDRQRHRRRNSTHG